MLTERISWDTPAPIRDDLTDLMIRLGRLAYINPLWTPGCRT